MGEIYVWIKKQLHIRHSLWASENVHDLSYKMYIPQNEEYTKKFFPFHHL